MAPLYDAYGRPVIPRELTREKAAPALTGVRTFWDDTVASGLTPPRLAALLQAAAMGDHYEFLTLAEEMEERDLHYASELSKRKLAVSRLPIAVEAYSDSPQDVRLADEVRALVRRPGFRNLIKDLLDALGKGYSVVEILWDRTGPRWIPQKYKYRDPRFFQFDQVSRSEIRLRDEADLANGVALSPFGFIAHVPRIKTGIPIRGGLARLAAWAYMCKGYTVKDWLAFAEVFGLPIRLGKYNASASVDDIAVLKSAVANIGSDAAAVIPESMQLELKEVAAKGGSAEFFKTLAQYMDDQVSKGILGQTASSSGTPGRLGNDDLQAEVRDDIRDDDAEQLEETLGRDLVKPFIDLNFGPQENYPALQLRAPKAEDVVALVTALEKLVPLGLKVEQSVVRDRLNIPDPDPKAKPEDLLAAQPAPAPPAVNRALNRELNREQDAPDAAAIIADRALDQADGSDLAAAVERLLAEAESLEDVRDRLLALYPTLEIGQAGEVLGEALLVADLAGRAAVKDEA
ncbi:MAG: DUF935 domain-containing protein [Desulfuromonadales bacterium]|nr:DUF935 domain-containing protein [Desulfuromonadales bacterium]